jgi:exonuclease SbcD
VRLAHLADVHLGFRQYYRQTPAGINQREADVANAFRRAIDGVILAAPDLVLVGGDLFHAVRPSNQSIVFCFREFQRLKVALPDAKIVLVAGNHDTPRATETGSILRLFAELDIVVAAEAAEDLVFPDRDLLVRVLPHQALASGEQLDYRAPRQHRYEVLLAHGEVENLWPLEKWWAEPGGALIDPRALAEGGWTYVALGHYHVMREVRPGVWYSGALDYVTLNPWGELAEQHKTGVKGKGWLLADLDKTPVTPTPQYVAAARGIYDLKAIAGRDLAAAELDAQIAQRLAAVPGGIADQIIRLVVHDVPRHVAREVDHAAIRAAKASALHFHLDLRRPDAARSIGVGVPGPRQTLTDVLRVFLARRPLPEKLDRDRFVERGVALLEAVGYEPGPGA